MSTTIFVSSPDTYGERRIDLHWTLEYFKARLEQITGIPSSLQSLTVFHSVDDYERFKSNGSGDGVGIGSENDLKTLMELGIVEMCLVRITNTSNPASSTTDNNGGGEFTDLSSVQKYELTFDEYEKRPDTVLATLKARGLGRYAPPPPVEEKKDQFVRKEDQVVGARCLVLPPSSSSHHPTNPLPSGFMGTPMLSLPPPIPTSSSSSSPSTTSSIPSYDHLERRGTIRFVGAVEFGDGGGDWIGVELDEPTGKNDGSVAGHMYFSCPAKRGIFVRPERVQVGDYEEVDEFASDDEEEI